MEAKQFSSFPDKGGTVTPLFPSCSGLQSETVLRFIIARASRWRIILTKCVLDIATPFYINIF